MIQILSKPADQIDIHDIESLIESKVPEGEQIEFKEALPAGGKSPDPWTNGQDEIGDRAKNALLEETVAFANSHGGALVLGIKETGSKPPVAKEIKPVPRCGDLADRLKLVFRDCVEPQLPFIEILGVETEGRNGVVILRVGRSRQAPHRITKTLVCPVRRSDRCEKMTMREIQDMTLNVARGLERLNGRLNERHDRFPREFERLSDGTQGYGLRMTAVPVVEDLPLDRAFRGHSIIPELAEPWRKVFWHTPKTEIELPWIGSIDLLNWRPMLRAARADPDSSDPHYSSYREIHWDGLLELGFVWEGKERRDLHPEWPIVIFANLAAWADRVRRYANAPSAEYAIEVQLFVQGRPINVQRPDARRPPPTLEPGSTVFPRYALGDPTDVGQLLKSFHHDFWNRLGQDVAHEDINFLIENWPAQNTGEKD